MKSYDDPPDHSLGPGDCLRCECHESRHTEHEVVDGPCEYELIGARQ